jgi:protein-L-isoaspartate(D-aspartate) O-methyltransferase
MVEQQVAGRGVRDRRVLDAMQAVPRAAFVPIDQQPLAYADSPLPIAAGQTISQPFVVALMIEALELRPNDRVLEVGAGSGYATAILSRTCAHVYAIERHAELAAAARATLDHLGYVNVDVREGDGTLGWPGAAPFDAILVSAGGPAIPEALRSQLGLGGRLVIPIGRELRRQRLVRVTRQEADRFVEEDLGDVAFVPLIGAQGWTADLEDGWQ